MRLDGPRSLSIRELVGEISVTASELARKEIQLAKAEIAQDLRLELSTVKGLAIALVLALLGVNMLLVALVLALASHMPGWLAALAVAGALLIAGAVVASVSWSRRVTRPLGLTRKTLRELRQWAKERLA